MKFKTTKKEIEENYAKVICVGYDNLQSLLNYRSPVAYTTRREGWGADIYDMGNGTCIVTGYAPFGNIRPGYEINRKYEEMARKALTKEDKEYLINEYLKEVLK